MFASFCFFVDLLQPPASLSTAFQETDIDTVAASSAMAKAKRQLASSMEKEPDKMPTMKHCFSKVEKDTNQAVQLKNAALDEVRKRASFYVPPQMLRHLKQTAMKTTAFSVIKELD